MNFTYSVGTEEQLQQNANTVKDLVLRQLEEDGLINNAEHLAANYVVGFYKKGRFGKMWDKVWKWNTKDDSLTYIIFKTHTGTPIKIKKSKSNVEKTENS